MRPMKKKLHLARTLALGLALTMAAGSAGATLFTVTMSNGTSFETRYRPVQSEWDEGKVMIMTDTANWIAINKSEIVGVESQVEASGFGFQLNTTTLFLGWTPNDVADEEVGPDGEVVPRSGNEEQPAYQYGDESSGQDYSFEQFLDIPTEGEALGGGINLDAANDQ